MGFLDRLRGNSPTAPTPPAYGSSRRERAYYERGSLVPALPDPPRPECRGKQTVRMVRARGAAISMEKITASGSINMRKSGTAAVARFERDNLTGIRGKGIAVWDHSWSMEGDYENGNVQTLGEMTLGVMLQFCTSVILIAFDSGVYVPIEVNLDNYKSVAADVYNRGSMGSTNLADALRVLRDIVAASDEWCFGNVLTDGVPNGFQRNPAWHGEDDIEPGDDPEVTAIVCDLANYACMLKFTGVRDVAYLQFLDDLETFRPGARLLDNCDTKTYPGDLRDITPEQFADDMADEMRSTIDAQIAAGLVVAV